MLRNVVVALGGVYLLLGIAATAYGAEAPSAIRRFDAATIIEPDGRATRTVHVEVAVNNDAAARQEAQPSLLFTEGVETVDLIEGFTVKPDGRRLPVAPDAVRVQLAPGVPGIPAYGARKQIVAVFPDVAAGDVLSYTWRRRVENPLIPGQFLNTSLFSRTVRWDDATVSVSVPPGMTLATEAFGPTASEDFADGHHVYRWHWSAPALVTDPAVLSPIDRVPRILVSTLPDWTAFSRIYAGLVGPKTEVTPRIQRLADDVAAGAPDRRDEARRLYEWVAAHIRWVAIYLGNGAFVPHTADAVLTNGYGDCKDQVVLLLALLRARGIAGEPVLINLGPSYTPSGVPSLTAFNHLIAYLPDWQLYADTTAVGATFGTLRVEEYGKPILHIRPDGVATSRMGTMLPGFASEETRSTMRLDADGRITGDTVTHAAGPYATTLRGEARRVSGTGGQRFAIALLRRVGETGTGDIETPPVDPSAADYTISATFSLEPRPGILDGDSFTMPVGMRMLTRPGDGPLGPIYLRELPASEPTPCYAARQDEELTLTLPPGYRPARLPRDRRVDEAMFRFESHWSFEDNAVRVRRSFVSQIAEPLCQGALRAAAVKATPEIRRDRDARIELTKVSEKTAD